MTIKQNEKSFEIKNISKGDWIEVEYTGRVKETDSVFDTTDEVLAKETEIFQENAEYGPIVICLGEGHLIPGLDKQLEGKEIGKDYTFEITAEEGFGKKDAKLIQLIPTSRFKKDNVQPMPGMQVNIDGVVALIKSVSGGRTLVDFNHPLSGQDLVYTVKVNNVITGPKEKLDAFLKLNLGVKDIKTEVEDNKAKIELPVPDESKKELADKIKESVGLDAEFVTIAKEEKK